MLPAGCLLANVTVRQTRVRLAVPGLVHGLLQSCAGRCVHGVMENNIRQDASFIDILRLAALTVKTGICSCKLCACVVLDSAWEVGYTQFSYPSIGSCLGPVEKTAATALCVRRKKKSAIMKGTRL